jgi:hypothetical protein
VPAAGCGVEQVAIEKPRVAAPTRRLRHRDPVDIDEARIALLEPEEIGAVVVGVLIEGEQKGFELADAARVISLRDRWESCVGSSQDSSSACLLLSARTAGSAARSMVEIVVMRREQAGPKV